MTNAVRARTAHDDRPLAERSRYEQSFTQCMNLWEDHTDVRALTFHQRIGQAAAELLGIDAIRVWHDQALFKKAGGRQTDPHQDHPYWPMKETEAITAWIPFEGTTRASGSLAFLPGSHLIGMRKFVNIFFGEPEEILSDPELADIEPVYVDVPRGAVSFHHALTVHFADGNSTDRERAGAHDHLLRGREHPRVPLPALRGRSWGHRGGPADRQRGHPRSPGRDPTVTCRGRRVPPSTCRPASSPTPAR